MQPGSDGDHLAGAHFEYAKVMIASLTEAHLRESNLDNAKLTGADGRGLVLNRSTHSYVELSGADLSEAD